MSQINGCYASSLRVVGKFDDLIFLHDLQKVRDLLETRLFHIETPRLWTEIEKQTDKIKHIRQSCTKLREINFKITFEIIAKNNLSKLDT